MDIKAVFSLEYEKMGRGYNKLNMNQDYEVNSDRTSLFVKITKKFECGEKHHMKMKVLEPSGGITELITLFQPKGWITLQIYLSKKRYTGVYNC